MHAVRKIIGGKFVAHQSLTGKRKMQGAAPSIPSPLKEKSEEEQVSYFLIWSGHDGIELVSTWNLVLLSRKEP